MFGEDTLLSFADTVVPSFDVADFGGGLDFGAAGGGPSFDFQYPSGGPAMPEGGDASSFAGKLMGGVGDFASKVTANPLDSLSKVLGLGVTGLGVANTIGAMNRGNQSQQMQQQGQRQAMAAAQPAITYGNEQIDATRAGQLPPAMEALIADQVQKAKTDMRAKLAHLGVSDSTMLRQFEDEIDRKALALKAQFLQGQGSMGVDALLKGAGLGLNAGNQGGQQEALIANLLASVNQQMGLAGGRQ